MESLTITPGTVLGTEPTLSLKKLLSPGLYKVRSVLLTVLLMPAFRLRDRESRILLKKQRHESRLTPAVRRAPRVRCLFTW